LPLSSDDYLFNPPLFSSAENAKNAVKVKDIKKINFFMKPPQSFYQNTRPKFSEQISNQRSPFLCITDIKVPVFNECYKKNLEVKISHNKGK